MELLLILFLYILLTLFGRGELKDDIDILREEGILREEEEEEDV